MAPRRIRSTPSQSVGGSVTPRLHTPPLRDLTPDTSFGFDLIDFADQVVGMPFDPWQQWLAVRIGELLPDGRPRFRIVLVLVARQNGKTHFARVLTLYWLYLEQVELVLGTSTSRDYAKESWRSVCAMALANPWLAPGSTTRDTIGEETLTAPGGCRYKIAAANRRAGRSLTVHRLIVDEIREHQTFAAWDAAVYAMNAVPHGQAVAISNQGDSNSIVLDSLRSGGLDYIDTGTGDPRLGLFEWSAPAGADPTDPLALAMANPDLGNRIQLDTLMGQAIRAKAAGGEELAGFRTEAMCQRVHLLDAAIDEQAWQACGVDQLPDLAQQRERVALVLDVALDGSHATLVAAAAQTDGSTVVDVVAAWDGHGCAGQLKADLPALVRQVRPAMVGWFPNGPAAALAVDLRSGWAPRGTTVAEIAGDMTAVCMGLAQQVSDHLVRHGRDPLLDVHIGSAQRLRRGDAWVFTRQGAQAIDGAYAVAGAVHLARTMPPPRPPLVAL